MNTVKHFLKRDFDDSLAQWAMLGLITLIGSVCHYKAKSPVLTDSVLGYVYFLFFMLQIVPIWNGMFGRAISREYLLSLPISRTTTFGIMWLRSTVGMLPLIIYLWCLREEIFVFFKVVVSDIFFVPWLLGAGVLFLALLAMSQVSQADLNSGDKRKRYVTWGKFLITGAIDSIFLFGWFYLLVLKNSILNELLIVLACLVRVTFKVWCSYVNWMWGKDAKLFKDRKSITA